MNVAALLQRDVRTLLDELGYDLTLRRTTQGSYDPSTGQTGASSTTDVTVRAIMVDYEADEINGETVIRGDRKVIISAVDSSGDALSIDPDVEDELIGEGADVSVVNVRRIKSRSSILAFECQVRK